MTEPIRSMPPSEEYKRNWGRVFASENRPIQEEIAAICQRLVPRIVKQIDVIAEDSQ